jgi:hypothetical protein
VLIGEFSSWKGKYPLSHGPTCSVDGDGPQVPGG